MMVLLIVVAVQATKNRTAEEPSQENLHLKYDYSEFE